MRKSILGLMLAAAAVVLLLGGDAMAQRGGRGRSGGHRPGGGQQHKPHHKPHHQPHHQKQGGGGGDGGGSEAPGGDEAPSGTEAPSGGEVVTESEATETATATADYFDEKYLTIRNSTAQKVRFFVLIYTEDEGSWVWVPGTPGKTKKALSVDLEPGKSMKLQMDNEPVAAQKIRIWAKGADKAWNQYRNTDLYLVELDATGERRYQAADVATYVFDLKE
ncbi:MAG: hypothetical protein HY040_10540 [Planctomycetes bacterium]|nr:hypothetical protein [Planctomycetota bacterium]